MSKTYGIHDVQMRYNKDTDEIEILLPGNSSDPTKIIRLPNGGGGSGQGFPVNPAVAIVIDGGETGPSIDTSITNPPGLRMLNSDMMIQTNAPVDTTARTFVESNGNPINVERGMVYLRGNGKNVMVCEVDGPGVSRIGVFSKAESGLHAVQIPTIGIASDLPSALISLNSLVSGLKTLGWVAE